MVGTLLYGIVKPSGPLLRTYLHKAKLDATDAPLLIERQKLVKLLIQGSLVDIYPHTDALALGILAELWHIYVASFQYFQGRRRHLHLRTIPACIKLNILKTSIHTEVNTLHASLHIQATYTESLAWLNPRGILYLARGIEIEHHLLVIDQVDSLLTHHDESPRHIVCRDDVGRIEHRHLQLIVCFQLELASHKVTQCRLTDGCIKSIIQTKCQRTLCLFLPSSLALQKLYLVGMRLRPSIMVSLGTRRKAEGSEVFADVHKQTIYRL